MKRIALFGIFILVLSACAPAIRPVTDLLQSDHLWSGTILVRGDVIVHEGAKLVIEPGTTVVFETPAPEQDLHRNHPNFPGSELIVRGRIIAEGRADAPIVFRHADPDAPAGAWGGINLDGSPQALFQYCYFSQADSALHSRESTVEVRESIFRGNLVGVRFHSSRMQIERNDFTGNGSGIRFHFGAPIIRRNSLRGNGKAFFITSHPRDYRIERNNILESREYQVALGEEVSDDVEMAENFWGTVDPAVIAGTLFDGRRAEYLGSVRFAPFLDAPQKDAGASWDR